MAVTNPFFLLTKTPPNKGLMWHFRFFPRQHKLMGSSRIAPVCTGAGAGSGPTRFQRRFRMFWRRSGRLWCKARSGFRRRFRRLWCRAGSGSKGFRRRFRRRSGKLWCKARSGSTGFRRRFRRRCRGKSQVRFNRALHQSFPDLLRNLLRNPFEPDPALHQSLRNLLRNPDLALHQSLPDLLHSVQSPVRFNRVPEKVWEALVQSQFRFNRICARLIHGNPAEVFPALGFSARFRTICKNKTLRLLGIPQKLILVGHNWILNCGNWESIGEQDGETMGSTPH